VKFIARQLISERLSPRCQPYTWWSEFLLTLPDGQGFRFIDSTKYKYIGKPQRTLQSARPRLCCTLYKSWRWRVIMNTKS